MTSTKAGNANTNKRAANAPRGPSHSLAPEHLGEAASVAMLATAIGGVAVFIAGVAMGAAGLTMGTHFTGTQPPNLADLGVGQVIGGTLLGLLGVGLTVGAGALLLDLPRSRLSAIVIDGVAAGLAAASAMLLAGDTRRDPILLAALVLAFILFGGAGAILFRTRR